MVKLKEQLIVSFEGIDGSGKSTMINTVKEFLIAQGLTVEVVSPFSATVLGKATRELVLDSSNYVSGNTEVLAMMGSVSALSDYMKQSTVDFILIDRYILSFNAYQVVGRNNELAKILYTNTKILKTTFDILLDVDLSTSKERMKARNIALDNFDSSGDNFKIAIINGYRDAIKYNISNIIKVDANKELQEVTDKVIEIFKTHIDLYKI
jgi:dTMP kinase